MGCGPAGAGRPGEGKDLAGVGGGGDADVDDLGAPGDLAVTDGPSCPTNCSLGAKSCDGAGVRSCLSVGMCNDWSTTVPCGGGQVCSGGLCVATCTNQCTAGATYCSGAGFRTCITTVAGCTDWSPAVTACTGAQVCSGGVCTATCTDRCAPAAKQCAGSGIQSCEKKASGCNDWGDPIPCGSGQVCSGGSCAVGCADQCTNGTKMCMGADAIQTCTTQASGCTDWSIAQVCGSGVCSANVCVPCTTGQKRCNGANNVESCSGGVWAQTQSCVFGCNAGACTMNVMCTAGQYRCSGNTVEICNSSGTAYLYAQTCAVSCAGGLCTGACTPSQKRCNGTMLEKCNTGGTAWALESNCGFGCDQATTQCALDKLDVTANAQSYDGVLVVNGPVTVKNGGVLKSPGGELTIRATSIIVEDGGSINIDAVSTSGPGTGSGGNTCCNCGGTGGGYGTAGTNPSCGGSGATYGTSTDSQVLKGSPGSAGYNSSSVAAAPGGKGGGMLRLIADVIHIKTGGNVTVNGGTGTSGSGAMGGGGGGSGGGILLAADQITIAGNVSAAGGGGGPKGTSGYDGGKGGDGRVKILYGSLKSVTGTVTGVRVDTSLPALTPALLPPLTITSTTHPNVDLVYNDDFPVFAVTWNQPFPSRLGYYWLQNTTASQVPSPSNGATFSASEALSLDRSRFTPGAGVTTYYVHLASQDSMSAVSGIENFFQFRVNTTPPTLTSTTHTNNPATFSTNNNPHFQWAPTQADANYKGVYYVLDHYGATVPTQAATFLPITQKQLQLAALEDGVWAFHVVAVDQQNYLTKQAAHFRIKIGQTASPGTNGITGTVSEAGAPLTGVRISVNRGLFASVPTNADATTNSSGTYSVSSVPVGTWEVEASNAGYQTAIKMIAVPASGGAATADFTLIKLP
jgi:hypothetical protein